MQFNTELVTVEDGYSFELKTVQLLDNVQLAVYDDTQATLTLGTNEVHFQWNSEVATLFKEIDICEPIKLLALLSDGAAA